MKFTKFVLLCSIATFTLFSCKDSGEKKASPTDENVPVANPKELLVNTWIPIKVGDDPADTSINLIRDMVTQYTAGGKYIITGLSEEPIEMDYKLGDDGKTITFSAEGFSENATINQIEPALLVVTNNKGVKIEYKPK